MRGTGATLTPVAEQREDGADLSTADGKFRIAPAKTVNRVEQAITMYRTDTAEAVPTDVNEALRRLRKRFPDKGDFARTFPQLAGRYAFTLGVKNEDGEFGPPIAILNIVSTGELCWLNPASVNFGYTRNLGVISICRYNGLWNALRLEQHIRSKHEGVWPMVERDIRDKKEGRDQERLTLLIETVMRERGFSVPNAPEVARRVIERQGAVEDEKPPLYVKDSDKAETQT